MGGPKRNNAKLGQQGSIKGHVTVEARNFKFGMHWPLAVLSKKIQN